MKRIKKIALWSSLLLYVIIVMSFVSGKRHNAVCHSFDLIIRDSSNQCFIDKEDITDLLKKSGIAFIGKPVDSIPIALIERELVKHPAVKNAEIYLTIYGKVVIELEQRSPIVRVINRTGESFYIDEEGRLMPLIEKSASRVLVANGNIKFSAVKNKYAYRCNDVYQRIDPYSIQKQNLTPDYDIPALKQNDRNELDEIFSFAKFIAHQEFWKSQIEQMYIVKRNDFELIPRVGDHIIVFGGVEDSKHKLNNLLAMYRDGFKRVGWNKYKVINIKYKGQVICSK